ncbi:MAG: AAA family ATPase, partial [bacterium]|nr:AAA family ATPase [bacterium]
KNVNSASFGMKKKLSIAMALLHAPSVLFMDEPFKGLDPVAARSVREIMARLSEKKVTLFITTHLAAHIEEIIDGFAILSKGKILHLEESLKESARPVNLEEVFFSCITPPPRPELQWIR